MMFWASVGVAYLLILAVGFAIGMQLVNRPPRGGLSPAGTPAPSGPSHGAEWTEFDAGFMAATHILSEASQPVNAERRPQP